MSSTGGTGVRDPISEEKILLVLFSAWEITRVFKALPQEPWPRDHIHIFLIISPYNSIAPSKGPSSRYDHFTGWLPRILLEGTQTLSPQQTEVLRTHEFHECSRLCRGIRYTAEHVAGVTRSSYGCPAQLRRSLPDSLKAVSWSRADSQSGRTSAHSPSKCTEGLVPT